MKMQIIRKYHWKSYALWTNEKATAEIQHFILSLATNITGITVEKKRHAYEYIFLYAMTNELNTNLHAEGADFCKQKLQFYV